MPGSEVCAAPIVTERPDCSSHAKVASQQGREWDAPQCPLPLTAAMTSRPPSGGPAP